MVQPAVLQEVQNLIRSVQRKMTLYFSMTLHRHGLTISQFALLVQLGQESPQKMSSLARRLYVSMPAVTHLVDRLEAKRMLKRTSDPADRRVCLIRITAKGTTVVAKTQGYLLQIFTGGLEGLRDQDHKTVIRFYEQFNRVLEERLR